MKKRFSALLLALSLLLTGCASLLEQEYWDITPYNAVPTAEGDPDTLRAESYQELVNALLYLVTSGKENGRIRLYLNSAEIDNALETACLEVVQEDPLAAYCVEYIKHSVQPVVTYADAEIQIVYRRSQEQINSISSVTGVTAIRNELEEALSQSAKELVLRVSYFDGNENFIHTLCRQAFYANPMTALDLPDIAVSIYPDTGRQRIVEMALTYHLEPLHLEQHRKELEQAAQQFLQDFPTDNISVTQLVEELTDFCAYSAEGGSTAYHALVEQSANSEGLALAMAALCDKLGVSCRVVSGTKDGAHHVWNLISRDEGWYHLDLTRSPVYSSNEESDEVRFLTDQEMTDSGYLWDTQLFPQSVSLQSQIDDIPPLSTPEN